MSHYDDAERLLARSPSAPAALVHAVLAVADALDPANTVAASVTPEPWAQELRQQVAQRREESLDQAAHERDEAQAAATNPPRELFGEMLWVVEQFYVEGVTIGLYDGFTFRVLPSGSDDCSVTHWARIETPLGPEDE